MSTELTILAWTLVLAFVQIMLPAQLMTKENGNKYNAGPRDTPPRESALSGRLRRAQANLFETLPLFAAGLLIAHVANLEGALTYWGAWLFLIGRIIYLPLYAYGIPYWRSAAWTVSLAGLVAIFVAILWPW